MKMEVVRLSSLERELNGNILDIGEEGAIYYPVVLKDDEGNYYLFGYWDLRPMFISEIFGFSVREWENISLAFKEKTGIDPEFVDSYGALEFIKFLNDNVSCEIDIETLEDIGHTVIYPVICELDETEDGTYLVGSWVYDGKEALEIMDRIKRGGEL